MEILSITCKNDPFCDPDGYLRRELSGCLHPSFIDRAEAGESQQDAHSYHHSKPGPVREVNSLSDNTPGEQEGIFSYLGKGLFRFSQQKALYSLSGPLRQHFFLGTWLSLPKRPLKKE